MPFSCVALVFVHVSKMVSGRVTGFLPLLVLLLVAVLGGFGDSTFGAAAVGFLQVVI